MKIKVELIGKEVEVIKTKLFSFLAIAGGSWGYGFKSSYEVINYFAIILFAMVSIGTFINMTKLGVLESNIKNLKDNI